MPRDIMAGMIIAALSIPISMGYAQIAGLTPVYGLYASILPAIVFALFTNTQSIVFGMDSAAVAVTGGVILGANIALGSDQAFAIMPMLTLLVAGFLMLFALTHAGKLIHYVPEPVMKGFILGISITIIAHQIPDLLGAQGLAITDWKSIASQVNMPSVTLSLFALATLFFMGHYTPHLPAALITLAFGLLFSATFGLEQLGVGVLGDTPRGLPGFTVPHITGVGFVVMLSGAFSIAVTVAIESLLTLNTFSMSEGTRPHGDRELLSLALGNAASSFIGCPPCSASLSRTAAAKSAGGVSQLASIFGALVIAAFLLVLAPYLEALPQPVLAAIIVYAMVYVVDFKTIRRYALKLRIEFVVLVLVAVAVVVLGAMSAVAVGMVVSLATHLYRSRAVRNAKLIGFDGGQPDTPVFIPDNVIVEELHGFLSFTNIDGIVEDVRKKITKNVDTVVFEISDVTSLDSTASETLRRFYRVLSSRGIHVRIVRSLALSSDHYTRYELRRLMKRMRIYPTVRAAIDDVDRMKRKQLQVIPLDTEKAHELLREELQTNIEGERAVAGQERTAPRQESDADAS